MADLVFWAVAAALAVAVAATLISALGRQRGLVPAAVQDLQVYRDQLAEVDRDLTRGTIAAEEAQRVRTEVSRRLLDADRALRGETAASGGIPAVVPVAVVVGLIAAAGAAYWQIGAPGYPDLPLEQRLALSEERMQSRPSQAELVAAAPKPPAPIDIAPDFLELMQKLRTATAERPDDPRGLELLSRNEAALGNYIAAEAAQRQVIALKAADATSADHAALAEIMIAAAGGFVSPEAEAELVSALKIDPTNPAARYYSGVLFAEVGRFDRTFALWQPLLEEGPADAPWIAPIRTGIAEVAFRAGVNYELPPEKGPTAADVGAAADMALEERETMIEGMVAQLSDRLATEGGTVEDWNRLIRSLTVLERRQEAQAIYDEAKTRFAGQNAELSFLRLAAVETGLVP